MAACLLDGVCIGTLADSECFVMSKPVKIHHLQELQG